jgi:tricorn protease
VAFTTEEAVNPASRLGLSALHIADVGGGPPRVVVEADAMQASWSPSGQHLVYWSTTGGQRDLYTVAIAGGTPMPVTQDPASDWSPVWSPDGDYIYFSSDRGGAMNLWRIRVDGTSGRPRGEPEPVTVGVQASSSRPRFSRDGARLAFASAIGSVNPVAIPFDPATLRAGVPAVLATENNIRVPSDVSAKGDQVAYFSIGDWQEDIFVGRPGGPMRRVTDDAARDRAPVFTADGRSLVFYSSREGNWGAWTIGVDGGGLRKITGPDSGVMYPQISPSGNRIVFAGISAAIACSPRR